MFIGADSKPNERPEHALQRAAASRFCCNRRAPWPPSLALSRSAALAAMRALTLAVAISLRFAEAAEIGPVATNALQFFLVSKQPIAGGRFINTANFPNLGYISNSPALVLTRLQEVRTNDETTVIIDEHNQVTTNTAPAVSIAMFPEDTKRFAAFTRQNVNAKVLVTWRDQPLMAPRIIGEIEQGRIALAWEGRRFPREVVEGIQALLRRE